MTGPLDASNFKYDLPSIGKYCDDGKFDDESRAQINSVFKQCDKEDANGKKVEGGDGELNKNEQANFKRILKNKFPALYDKMTEFFIMLELIEDKVV